MVRKSPSQLAVEALQQIARHEKECGERYGEVQSELRGLIEKISNLQQQVSSHSKRWEKISFLVIGTVLAAALSFWVTTAQATDTVTSATVSSSTVVDKTPPTASSPSIVVNNSDICQTGNSAAIQTGLFGISGGTTVTDEVCRLISLARSVYGMGLKVAGISLLCQDHRVWNALWYAGTPCPYMGAIGDLAKAEWLKNTEKSPVGSIIRAEADKIKVAALAKSSSSSSATTSRIDEEYPY